MTRLTFSQETGFTPGTPFLPRRALSSCTIIIIERCGFNVLSAFDSVALLPTSLPLHPPVLFPQCSLFGLEILHDEYASSTILRNMFIVTMITTTLYSTKTKVKRPGYWKHSKSDSTGHSIRPVSSG